MNDQAFGNTLACEAEDLVVFSYNITPYRQHNVTMTQPEDTQLPK